LKLELRLDSFYKCMQLFHALPVSEYSDTVKQELKQELRLDRFCKCMQLFHALPVSECSKRRRRDAKLAQCGGERKRRRNAG
jgi:hypothetical protein